MTKIVCLALRFIIPYPELKLKKVYKRGRPQGWPRCFEG